MNYLTLNEAKQHLNMNISEVDDDDSYIESLIELSQDLIEREFDIVLLDEVANNNDILPFTLKHVMKILIADYYEFRSSINNTSASTKTLDIIKNIMRSYKKYDVM